MEVHVLNIAPIVALNSEFSENIWFGKNFKYDHLRGFGCKAFVHILKDERFKLDAKSKKCIFIDYGQDEFGYRLYDHVGEKLFKIFNMLFMEDQTIEDVDKVEKTTPKKDISLSNIGPVQLHVHNLDTIGGDHQNGEPRDYVDDQQVRDELNIPTNNDKEETDVSQDEDLGEASKSSQVQLMRSNR